MRQHTASTVYLQRSSPLGLLLDYSVVSVHIEIRPEQEPFNLPMSMNTKDVYIHKRQEKRNGKRYIENQKIAAAHKRAYELEWNKNNGSRRESDQIKKIINMTIEQRTSETMWRSAKCEIKSDGSHMHPKM